MKSAHLWLAAIGLAAVSLYLLFLAPGGSKDSLGAGAVSTTATIAMKDTRPGDGGAAANYVTLIFEDSMRKNHRVEIRVMNGGLFNSLETGKETRILYQPANPEQVVLSADARGGVASPTLRFIAWSLLLAGLCTGYSAYRRTNQPAEAPAGADDEAPRPRGNRKGGPKVTITRR